MSSATKRRLVEREQDTEFIVPEASQFIVRVLAGRGNNLHEVEDHKGIVFLASMPNKFRRTVWIKKGDYVVCSPIHEGDKVQAEIVQILSNDSIQNLRELKQFPVEFETKLTEKGTKSDDYQIDADMLPPSASESEEENSDGEEREGDYAQTDTNVKSGNPNRGRGIFQKEQSGD